MIIARNSTYENPPASFKQTDKLCADSSGVHCAPSGENWLKLRKIITAHTEMEAIGTVGPRTLPSVRISVEALSARMSSPPWSRTYTVSLWHLENRSTSFLPRVTCYKNQKATSFRFPLHEQWRKTSQLCSYSEGQLRWISMVGWKQGRWSRSCIWSLISLSSSFGVLYQLVSNSGINLKNILVKILQNQVRERASFSLAYCPHSNGTVEIEWWELLRTLGQCCLSFICLTHHGLRCCQ